MRKAVTTAGNLGPLTETQLAQLRALEGHKPDTADLPEISEENWRRTRRFFKPRKEPIGIRLDADILDWLRRGNEHCQVEINRILRKEMETETPG